VRNDNPVPVAIAQLDLTLPGGFSYRPGTTTGALTADPVPVGAGSLTQRWSQSFTIPQLGEAVIRVGVRAGSALGDHFASARAYPADSYAFSAPETGLTARVTTEAAQPTGSCTITGTEGDDVLVGTPGPDVICGLGGDDELHGLGAGDELWGGTGDDRLEGGDGDDSLRGGDGNDVIDGEAGHDVVRGGGGLDTITYATRTAPLTVTVGDGEADDGELGEQDTISSDVEIVRGGAGNDQLTGGPGPDELYGRAGDDTLDGGDGAGDLLDGGDGNDTLKDNDGFVDRIYCGGDTDNYDADLLDRIVGCELPFATEGLL
jgi:Ca2+-binding RTX toxin-like protein